MHKKHPLKGLVNHVNDDRIAQNRSMALLTIHGHFVNLRRVVLLNVTEDADVIVLHKVNGDTFAAITT